MSRWSTCVLCTLMLGLVAGCRTTPIHSGDSYLPVVGSDSDELGAPPAGDVVPAEGSAEVPLAPAEPAPTAVPAAPAPSATASGLPPCPPPPPPSSMGSAATYAAPPTPGVVTAPPGTQVERMPSVVSVGVPATESMTCCPDPRQKPWRGNYDWMTMPDRGGRWPNAYLGLSGSFMPNVGVGLTIGGIYKRTESIKWAWEVKVTWQPFDDELFADDGNPTAGDWWQAQGGVKISSAPLTRRHLTGRWGGVWANAGSNPNIVNESGNYFGAYAGIGYEADLSPCFTTGPELSAMLMWHQDGEFVVVPQFNWHFIWSF